jgi:protein-S-isoprenylcysteine O-methyltransferase Ste14
MRISTMHDAVNGKGKRKWWYGIAVMLMICVFFVGMDYSRTGSITWSVWPVAAVLFFGVGFSLLNRFGRE